MKKVLVTGAGGFIARNFIETYKDRYDIVGIDKISHCTDVKFLESMPPATMLKDDILSITPQWLEKAKITHVINFAAESHVDNSINSPFDFTVSNTLATHSLLDACQRYGKLEKFVQIGTDEVYGTLGPSDRPFTEETPLAPNSPYSASKAAQDLMCRAYFETYRFPVVITRCSNNYGPWQHPEKFIPKVISNMLSGDSIPVYGNGLNVRDWIHVDDHCRGIMLALEYGEIGKIYNFGGDCELNNLDVIETIVNVFNELEHRYGDEELRVNDVVKFVDDRKGHDLRYSVDFWRAKNELGFEPTYSFYEGIFDLVMWAFENESWLNERRVN